jgi:hypothetical protein
MRTTHFLGLFLALAGAASASGQEKVFDWQQANDESVRLDPANYHTGRTYRPGPQGGNIHLEIEAQQPVTIALVDAEAWNDALQHPEAIQRLNYVCLREHVVKTTYLCDLPAEPMTLIVRDERNSPDRAIFAGLGAVLNSNDKVEHAVSVGIATVMTGQGPVTRTFKSPNDLHIQYFRWACVSNCFPPEIHWLRQAKEKYELTSFLKVYGGYTPQRDGEQISVQIKSPVPMLVAILPSSVADQLHEMPEMLEPALAKNSCQQRGVQSQSFECTFNVADGPQSLVVVPESGAAIPGHKKAEIEMLAAKCVANCTPTKDNSSSASSTPD